jgi:hypothetical protein
LRSEVRDAYPALPMRDRLATACSPSPRENLLSRFPLLTFG